MTGYIHSIQSMGTLDGPGVRSVVFTAGCPLRCAYCHNPDTWGTDSAQQYTPRELTSRLMRYYPYIRNGGVTFSGGEPCLQAEFLSECALLLKKEGLHLALDTCGQVLNPDVERLLSLCELVILDIKFTSQQQYKDYTGGSLEKTLSFLEKAEELGKELYIRQVILPGINDRKESVYELYELIKNRPLIKKAELLPFRKLCLEKYEALGIPFPLREMPEADKQKVKELEALLNQLIGL